MIMGADLLDQAAECPDPARRLVLVTAGLFVAFNTIKSRKKKPFNPMLGETYELVTDKFRLVSEKVQHLPV